MQYSTTTLLTIMFLCAVAVTLARFDSLLVPFAYPFTLGPIAAYRVTRSREALLIGALSSAFWMIVSIVPFGILASLASGLISFVDERFLTRDLLVTSVITYFLASSLLGGYIGGVVAKPD